MLYREIAATWLQDTATASLTTQGVSRLPWTPEHRAAPEHINRWMKTAGPEVARDPPGTLVGSSPQYRGQAVASNRVTSVQCAVRRSLRRDHGDRERLPYRRDLREKLNEFSFAPRILAFANDEGVRFPTVLIGPRALTGTVHPSALDMTDKDGTRMRDATAAFGLAVAGIADMACGRSQVIGDPEARFEQGAVLKKTGQAV